MLALGLIVGTWGLSFRGGLRTATARCDCGCCVVSNRHPSLEINNVNAMCAVIPPEDNTCSDQCQTDPGERVIKSSGGSVVDYSRFCFLECRPPDDATFGMFCTELTEEQREAVTTQGGNGVDLASLAASTDVTDGVLGGTTGATEGARAGSAGATASSTNREAQKAEEEKERHALAAASEAQSARAAMIVQYALTEAEGARRAVTHMAESNLDDVATIRGYEAQIEMHHRAAIEARKRTQSAVHDIENAAKDAAEEVAQEAKAIVAQDASTVEAIVKQQEARFNPPALPTAEAGARAAAPYNAALSRAMAIQGLYSAKAQELSGAAKTMQDNARQLAADAAAYRNVGDPNAAPMLAKVQDLVRQATQLDNESRTNQKIADQINEGVPAYQISAANAALRAAILANTAERPPLPV